MLNQLAREGLVVRKKRLGSFVLPAKGRRTRPSGSDDLCIGLFHFKPEAYLYAANLAHAVVDGLHGEIEKLDRHLLYISCRRSGRLPDPDDIPWNILYGLMVLNVTDPAVLGEIGRWGRDRTVLIDVNGRDFDLHSVSFRNYEAGADLAALMLQAGHRRFLMIRQKAKNPLELDPAYTERNAGFMAAVKAVPGATVAVCDSYRKVERPAAYDRYVARIVRDRAFTAVFAPGTNLFQALQPCFDEAGLRFPADYSVAGVGDPGGEGVPGITHVSFDMTELGQAGVRLLAELVAQKPEGLHNRLVGGKMIPGHSIALPPKV
ncbi:MAG: substrate-binding domain-containing protein [Planctomycetota bacterium]